VGDDCIVYRPLLVRFTFIADELTIWFPTSISSRMDVDAMSRFDNPGLTLPFTANFVIKICLNAIAKSVCLQNQPHKSILDALFAMMRYIN